MGTQLSLAIVRLLEELEVGPEITVRDLATLSGRGRRSGIGLHGFVHGGLIVDGGRRNQADPPPLVARAHFPEDWSILIVRPPGPRGRHGEEENQAFSELPVLPERITERLCRLVLLGILPALAEHNLPAFGAAVSELQHHVGSLFAPLQGGLYASRESAALIDELERLGLAGAGQSSWGPSLYAFGEVSESEQMSISARIQSDFGLDASAILWTRAANHGAVLERLDAPSGSSEARLVSDPAVPLP